MRPAPTTSGQWNSHLIGSQPSVEPLIDPFPIAGVKLLEPSTSDVVVARGSLLDTLATGRLGHAAQR